MSSQEQLHYQQQHLRPTKPATPKRTLPGEDQIEDIASGITGLEARSSAADHPLPLLRSNAAHIAARLLASAVSARIAQSSSPSVVSLPVSPSPSAVSARFAQSSSPSIASLPVSPSLLQSDVSPGIAGAS